MCLPVNQGFAYPLEHQKAGQPITDQSGQMPWWTEYFEELLNYLKPEDPPDIATAPQDLDISCGPPTSPEIRIAISQLKNGKAVGPDKIPPEALKNDIVTSEEALQSMFQKIWSSERVPESWREGHLIKLPKKGDLSNWSNYIGIMLFSVEAKVFNRVLLNRMREAVDADAENSLKAPENDPHQRH